MRTLALATLALALLLGACAGNPASKGGRVQSAASGGCGYGRSGELPCPAVDSTHRRASNGQISRIVASNSDIGGRSGSCLRFSKTLHRWCGCGAADHLGMDNRDGHWNLSNNWFRLPAARPGHNMAVVRSGHVAVLDYELRPGVWMAFDYNSGGNRAHHHPIKLSRYRKVVNPFGSRSMSARTRYR